MAAIDTSATCSDRRNIYNPAPSLLQHMWHSEFRYDERASEIDVDGMVPLLDVNLEDIAHSLAVASIHDKNVRMLAMLSFHLIEEALQISLFANITLVR
jgi:hypothetical protein